MVLISKIVVCFACWAAEAAAIVDVVAFVESFDDSGVKGLFLKLSLAAFFWCLGCLKMSFGSLGLVEGVGLQALAGSCGAPGTMVSPVIPVRRLPMMSLRFEGL